MAKWSNDKILDKGLEHLRDNSTIMTACNNQPTNFTEATSTYKLADIAVAAPDLPITDGATTGRRVIVAAKNNIPIDTQGTITHVALSDGVSSELLYVTTVSNQQILYAGNTLNLPSWEINITDPV